MNVIKKLRTTNWNDFWQVFRITQYIFWGSVLFIILFMVGVNAGLLGTMPDLDTIQNPRNANTTTIYSSDLEVLGYYYTENRIEVEFKDLSPYLVKGLVATEDKRFIDHSGIDLKSLFRAVIMTGLLQQNEGGGSTLTQQLAKNLFHDDFSKANALVRMSQKLKEWLLAAKLEKTFTKDEIINLYFNTVWFGYNSYGIRTASQTYFYKKPKELKPEEAALLVGMLNGPGRFNPKLHPERTKERRNLVMRRMVEANIITQQQYDSLSKKEIKLNFHNPDYREGMATYFREHIRQELKSWCEKNKKSDGTKWNLYEDGLRIYTTIDSRIQKYSEEAMTEHLSWLQNAYFKEWKGKMSWKSGEKANPDLLETEMKKTARYKAAKEAGKSDAEIQKEFDTKENMTIFTYKGAVDTLMSPLDSLKYYLQIVQVGLLALDAQTGEVKAWIGGPNIRYFQLDHARKSTKRQVGSTIKPFQYAVALERGYNPCSEVVYSAPVFDGGKVWNPAGTNRWKEGEMVPMKEGLAFSDNRITAQLMAQFGPQALVEMARRLQIDSDLDPVPSLCLGSSDISLYEMVAAYTALANGGTWSKPIYLKRIEDKNGNVLAEFNGDQREAMSDQVAWTTTEMLKEVINKGTAAKMRGRYGISFPIAGKTGTTQSNSDAWFIAYTPGLVIGCWVGFDQPSVHFASGTGQGATSAMPIVAKTFHRTYGNRNIKIRGGEFSPPADSTFSVNFDCTVTPVSDTVAPKQPSTVVY